MYLPWAGMSGVQKVEDWLRRLYRNGGTGRIGVREVQATLLDHTVPMIRKVSIPLELSSALGL